MEYMKKNNGIMLKTADFNIAQTLDCGQAFRWEKLADNTYGGHMLNTKLTISAKDDYFILHDTSEADFLNIWTEYFDLHTDYGKVKEILAKDKTLAKAIDFAGGIRILKQDKWETLFSFIISQNNNIPRIKGIINRFCEHNGKFPDYADLKGTTADGFSYLRAGFRAKYIEDCLSMLNNGWISLDDLAAMPTENARKILMTIKGVGPKVADCVLLFGYYRIEVCPVDVWVKRVLAEYYPDGLPEFVLPYAGIAQQYLFNYVRGKEHGKELQYK